MLSQKGIVPLLVEQYNDLIDRNLIDNNLNNNQHDNNDFLIDHTIISDSKLIITNEHLSHDTVFHNNNLLEEDQKESNKSTQLEVNIKQNNEVLVQVSENVDQLSNEEAIKDLPKETINDLPEEIIITNENECELNSNESKTITETEEESEKAIIIKVNPILEDLMLKRKHSFVTKTIVPKEICGICSESIKFSEKYIQCVVCLSIGHLNCASEIPVPCIPYTNPNLKPGKTISNYVYPAFKPSIPSIVIHCCREIEERSHESSLDGLYAMKSEGLKQVKDLCDKILKSKNGFPLLKELNINLVCGIVKKFLSDFNESLISKEMWKQFSYNMRKKHDEEMKSLTKQLIMELSVTNRDTLCFIVLHLQHLATHQRFQSLVNFSEIFCPIICGDTEVTRKLRLMSTMLSLNDDFWTNTLLKSN